MNPMAQLARMYELIEKSLRKKSMYMHELREVPDIKALERNPHQVQHIVKKLASAPERYILTDGIGRGMKYRWNPDAPPFTLQLKWKHQAEKQSSEVIHREPEAEMPTRIEDVQPKPVSKEVELVLDGMLVTIGKNPLNGKLRITIDQ